MPTPALATTKRKFHKLLDSLTSTCPLPSNPSSKKNASSTTLPTASKPSKRLRLNPRLDPSRPRSAYVPPSKRTIISRSSPTRPSSGVIVVAPGKDSEHNPPQHNPSHPHTHPPPHFTPWDRGAFLERLKTYRFVDRWAAKPDERIGEVEWAKWGWVCVGRERVGCRRCGAEVVISLEPETGQSGRREDGEGVDGAGNEDKGEGGRGKKAKRDGDESKGEEEEDEAEKDEEEWRAEAQKVLVEKYSEMKSTAHESGCLWRRRGCDDTIHRLPVINPGTALAGLKSRYESLMGMEAELPHTLSTPEGLDTKKVAEWARPLLQTASTSTENDASDANGNTETKGVKEAALTLALFGWQAEEEGHVPGLATCTACFRRLGLWLFKTPATATDSTDEPEASMARLDPLGEHRDYCPWINAISQNGGSRRTSLDSLAGWQILLRAVRNAASRRREDERREGGDREGGNRKGIGGEDGDGANSEAGDGASVFSQTTTVEEEKRKDEERWARLKRLKQVFNVKGLKKKPAASEARSLKSAG